MEKISCLVLMPFDQEFSFVYAAIKAAGEKLNESNDLANYNISIERADEIYATKGGKVQQIINLIANCDMAIVDISGAKPNVMWELGYCAALKKETIVITSEQSSYEIPFNIYHRQIIKYRFNVQGLAKLTEILIGQLSKHLTGKQVPKSALRYEPEIGDLFASIENGLNRIEIDSLLQNLVKGEFKRLNRRINDLHDGRFDLRNKKPRDEVIRYYAEYVSQLNQEYCEFDTITRIAFWKEISDEGRSSRYLEANVAAVFSGTTIRRVFLIDEAELNHIKKQSPWFIQVIRDHLTESEEYPDRFMVRIFVSRNFERESNKYPNLAIWKKGNQSLLFFPQYSKGLSRSDELRQTDFVYYRTETDANYPEKNIAEINRNETRFNQLWEKAVPLTEKFLLSLENES